MFEVDKNATTRLVTKAIEFEKNLIIKMVMFVRMWQDPPTRSRMLLFAVMILFMALVMYTFIFFLLLFVIVKYF